MMTYGHVHMEYVPDWPRIRQYGNTTVVNAYKRHFIELPDKPRDQWETARGLKRWWRSRAF